MRISYLADFVPTNCARQLDHNRGRKVIVGTFFFPQTGKVGLECCEFYAGKAMTNPLMGRDLAENKPNISRLECQYPNAAAVVAAMRKWPQPPMWVTVAVITRPMRDHHTLIVSTSDSVSR